MSKNSTTESTHICVLCDSKLPSKEELQQHFRKHANKEIDFKGRSKQSNNKLNSNQKVSTTKRTYIESENSIRCDVCNQEFDNVTQAIQHKFRKHPESASKFFCPFCGMQFPIKTNRDKHLLQQHQDQDQETSSSREEFPCADCGVIFYTQEAHSYHTKSTHQRIMTLFKPVATPPPSKKIKMNNAGDVQSVYYCHLCGLEYIIKFNLQKHLERQHSKEERDKIPDDLLKCITCDALFYNKKAYDNHNMYHKPEDLYVTSEEQRLQTITKVDQDFDIRRVQTVAERYIPVYRRRRRTRTTQVTANSPGINSLNLGKKEKNLSEDELSPITDPESSESESEIPLGKRLEKLKK